MNIFLDKAVKKIYSHEGALCVSQFSDLPFTPKRLFYVKNVPIGTERGNHAHKNTEQLLVCVQGKIKIITHNGYTRHENVMEPNDAVLVKKMIWDSQIFLTEDSILLVLASTIYDEKDYITDFTEFKKIIRSTIV